MGITLELHPIGPVAVAGRSWRHRGRQLLTAIVKVTFEVHHDGVMTPVQPAPIVTDERHLRGSPIASLVRGSDLALLVAKPEVVIVGSAYAGAGQRVPTTSVRFAVQRNATMLISKRLDVVGDRRALPGSPPPQPLPFERMPIQYERALGGIASRENPVGIGMAPENDGLMSYPNIGLPASGGVAPAGFGPIPSAWPVRQARRGSMSWAAANTQLDVEVPDDFDDAYFQTAPGDQRTSELIGGELIAIVNMHPEIGTIRTYLPTSRGVALAQTASGERIPLSLRIDTVHIEPDAMRAEIVYRAALPLQARHSGQIWLAGALEPVEQRVDFPDLSTVKPAFGRSPRAQSGADFSGIAPARGHSGTMIIEAEPPPSMREKRPPADPPAPKHSGTMIIEAEVAPQSLPFAKRKRRPSGERAAVRAESGTPWAAQPPAPIQPAPDDPLIATLTDDVPPPETVVLATPRPPPPPAPPPPAPPPPASAEEGEPADKKSPWRVDPPPSAPPRTVPRPVEVPRANFKAGVYKKFKR